VKLADFAFDLPETLIAMRPARPRSSARLLLAQGSDILDRHVRDLPDILQPGDHLILNDTKVIPARLSGVRHRNASGNVVQAKVEVTLLKPQPDGCWSALAKPLRKLTPGETVIFSDVLSAKVTARSKGLHLRFNMAGPDFDAALSAAGAMPLPPYIAGKRMADDWDKEDYQTIWARRAGAVAAPTASLHFDNALVSALQARGVGMSFVTLHVGAGTFLPVTVDDVATHRMHTEWGEITQTTAGEINASRAAGGRIIPVGTTVLRLLETAARDDGHVPAWQGDTDIFIYPGYRFKVADALMTNFHLPKSTLMMLVSALMGHGQIRKIYAHAIASGYRFFSYGDSSLLIPSQT